MNGLVIPTRGDHPQLLATLIQTSDLPADRIIITTNNPEYHHQHQTTLIYDLGPTNIHRWWNHGLNLLATLGCTYATVLNDDVTIQEDSIPRMITALEETGATLSHPATTQEPPGYAWTINLTHGIRADERYSWWYGDNQLYHDANTKGHGTIGIHNLGITHHYGNLTTINSPHLQQLINQDEHTWYGTRADT